jgi:sugar lactone lactonase YvrE
VSTTNAVQFSAPITKHGEGPVWLGDLGLAVLDLLMGDVIFVNQIGQPCMVAHVGDIVAAVRPRRNGGLVAGTERGFCLLNIDMVMDSTVEAWDDPAVRMNDGACDPQGRFWCGSMAYDLAPGAGALWRYDPDGTITKVLANVGCSNGLAWTMDGKSAYYVDSLSGRVDSLHVEDDGYSVWREPFIDVSEDGFPDGLAVDCEDGIWLALFGSGQLIHVDRYGDRDHIVEVPVAQVTACTFGGADYRQLFITTSNHGLRRPEPEAGAVFVTTPDVPGFAPFSFAG